MIEATALLSLEPMISNYLQIKAPVIFLVLAGNGEILQANRYAEAVTGLGLSGTFFRNMILDFAGVVRLPDEQMDPSAEHLLHVKTGSGLPQSYYFTFQPVNDRILCFGRLDTEELEKMREDMLSLNHELNNLTRRLHKTNAQLTRLNEEKNRFLGMAAHDLRKPIGLILAYSEFLLDEASASLEEEQIGFLHTIHASSLFMKRLVDDFLDWSAIEAGRFDLDLQPSSIHEILRQSLTMNHLQAVKKGVRLIVERKEGIPPLRMDASKMEQVITNLVSNAIEHSNPSSEVVITLGLEEQSLAFSVQDSGPGIAPGDMDKLFKPFRQAGTKKTLGEKSTGLGLVITRRIIEAHGGRIWVESEVGTGTTIHVRIPRSEGLH